MGRPHPARTTVARNLIGGIEALYGQDRLGRDGRRLALIRHDRGEPILSMKA
jgi:hypothetical protein